MNHISKINPKKELSQCFISSTHITDQIVNYAGNISDYSIIEIGPGLGTMTYSILNKNPKKLISIEKDRRLSTIHEKIVEEFQGKYEFILSDALNIDLRDIIEPPVKVIANLPYHIATTLLIKWMDYINFFTSFTLMFQKEVADRIVAQPNNKNYGTLSILIQLLSNVYKMEDFGPEIFSPQPKVMSSVINIIALPEPRFHVNYRKLSQVLKTTFSERRKMIRSTLKKLTNNADEMLESLNIDNNLRPENLSIEQFCQITNCIN
ncbi:dimethyladenosine transferase [Ehrlichia chaffeensis str. Heartland]|uniref:Ribosomal RNA small subunit methyltransferase A n=1 Tax=Ehrlichia chaffeensis (strain ATCC CRL-10679 / Arkansas) TaxID=205920 RepID=RSMA_EHRCR|nr:16S rRNA (adenine(1518)-N(6)/adenine(1519)-N(6))-dimethyltransferase RsmA [Ehrlichia chaffeensis]Q2GGH6.2 RecName: Full=Ribosomal RNA small subunit methyltransferase A; AltName: Full=16S rRNA (adenine(1518)-N(6)/adenine(1519)-N(6))-dimethyltransferase; AltName: Full=16S rRNA dimethyladenosine transferase; AltName: Full=16S rRNA dimethylase; AltName: Full=S-adenosylmethionine-6-N', N'-adenosyl(rRNA) dimethyltransferase [Ehrlichia chaffeensis str. Arkansas]AHX03728.1 dimethyladenosine transferas